MLASFWSTKNVFLRIHRDKKFSKEESRCYHFTSINSMTLWTEFHSIFVVENNFCLSESLFYIFIFILFVRKDMFLHIHYNTYPYLDTIFWYYKVYRLLIVLVITNRIKTKNLVKYRLCPYSFQHASLLINRFISQRFEADVWSMNWWYVLNVMCMLLIV